MSYTSRLVHSPRRQTHPRPQTQPRRNEELNPRAAFGTFFQKHSATKRRLAGAHEEAHAHNGEAREAHYPQIEQQFRSQFPGAVDTALRNDRRAADAKARLESAFEGFRHSMTVQAKVVSNIRDDAALLSELSRRSQGAVGNLQAQQATNQLLALSTKQQLQLQTMMAAEFRSQAIERARRVHAEAEAKAATRRFLGSGKAYRPGN